MKAPKVTLILRTFGRPIRTMRMLECIQAQTMNGIELLFMGDACTKFQDLIGSGWFSTWQSEFCHKGNFLFFMNNKVGGRDYGAKVTNQAIGIARGKYTLFLDNDDKIKPEHTEFYYKSIQGVSHHGKPLDFVYNPVLVNGPEGPWRRTLALRSGAVGHAELIVRTGFLRNMPPHEGVYGQDWLLVQNMMKLGNYQQGEPVFPTYVVMSSHNYQEPGMEKDL